MFLHQKSSQNQALEVVWNHKNEHYATFGFIEIEWDFMRAYRLLSWINMIPNDILHTLMMMWNILTIFL